MLFTIVSWFRLGWIVTRCPDEVAYAVTWLGTKDSEVAWAKLGLKWGD